MNCIAAVDNKWAIGKDNSLLFHIPMDLQFFKEKTIGKTVIMGKNTLLSLPNQKPLPDRMNIVLSTSLSRNDCIVCGNLSSLFDKIKYCFSNDLFVIGGEQIYELLLPYCSTAYITKANIKSTGNKFFPNLDIKDNWKLSFISDKHIYNDIEFYFCKYENNAVRKTDGRLHLSGQTVSY